MKQIKKRRRSKLQKRYVTEQRFKELCEFVKIGFEFQAGTIKDESELRRRIESIERSVQVMIDKCKNVFNGF